MERKNPIVFLDLQPFTAPVAVLLEEKVVLVATSASLLTTAGEALRQLLHPLVPSCVYIPILPRNLLDFIMAPTPFLIGVTAQCRPHLPPLDDVFLVRPCCARG